MRALTDTEDNHCWKFIVLFLYLPIHLMLSLSPMIDSLGIRAHRGEQLMYLTDLPHYNTRGREADEER